MNQQKERKETKKNDNKIIASISEDDKNNIYDEQFDMFKQMVKNFENEEFDEEAFKFDTPLLKVNNFEKSKQKISLDDYLKSGRLLSLKKKNIINNSYNGQGDKATFKCPYCKYEYYEEMEKSVYTALRDFLETNHMKKDGEIITFNIPLIKQYEFCRLHQAKLVIIPEGIKKGYPLHIRFDLLKQRIYNFKNDLFDIIYGKKKSYFRELSLNEYERLGINKARNFNSLINRFEKILVGYYGSKGFNIITKILQDMFFIVIKTEKILTYELSKPQEPFEYIQEVLVPECGIRLIAEDNHLNKEIEEDLKKAREIMRNSNDFGLVVHEDNDNDDN
ncbi:hypothetical protein BCR36DRAFT_288193 [Piromyces finnis]|uniref:Restriction of telomere capping protein 4 n=1 Tax=Piromyces finnis TaxID=1754191 RepID=A0A1Y1VAR6_9FUNG|nr:hypothetical protein BCR36DRAFT_288193 [Piromyces finnis]|eukprot:ORX51396.1 hypothetical protein BCR36DRAFT_288193 [Piromyces finnis]